MAKSIVIAERDNIAAVFEDNKCTEFFIHRGDILLGDVYMKSKTSSPALKRRLLMLARIKWAFCTLRT